MQHTLNSENEVSLGRVCQHCKVRLAEETQARRELGLALLVVTDVRAYSVQMVLKRMHKAQPLPENCLRSDTPAAHPAKSQPGCIRGCRCARTVLESRTGLRNSVTLQLQVCRWRN